MIMRVILVDDEELALDRLSDMLSAHSGIQIVGTFTDPHEALIYAKQHKFDSAFLDITMPGMSGLELADCLMGLNSRLRIIFATGYDAYAVKAFELNAIDYLLKPIMEERLDKTVKKLEVDQSTIADPSQQLQISSLGGFELRIDNRHCLIKWRTTKTEELLAFLVHHYGRRVERDLIIENLWYDHPLDKSMDMLNVTTYNLRKAMNAIGVKDCILSNKSELWLATDSVDCLHVTYEKFLKDMRHADIISPEAIEQQIAEYRGDYFYGKDYPWADFQRESYRFETIKLLKKLVSFYISKHLLQQARSSLQRILLIDPLDTDVHEWLIKLWLESHQPYEAERQFHIYERLLQEELCITPDKELKKRLGL
jgi:two-component system, LytTR family, response regulator